MKKIFALVLLCFLVMGNSLAFAENEPAPASESAILLDFDTGRVLFSKNPDAKLYPASTTKIMTGILAIENLNMDTVVSINQTAIDVDRDGSNMGLLWNEEISLLDLTYGLLVHSANDAANALAENVSGSIDEFVVLMNKKAAELGMTNTNFVNTHGYHNDNHYTTAKDLSILCRYAMQNALFRQIVATPQYQIAPTNKYDEIRYMTSNNALINPNKGRTYLYSAAQGIKTGHTSVAGACFTCYAERDNMRLITVTMKAPSSGDSFKDTIALMEYGFNNYKFTEIAKTTDVVATREIKWASGDSHRIIYVTSPVTALIPKNYNAEKLTKEFTLPDEIKAPVKAGTVLGEIKYFYDGEEVGSASLTITEDVKRSFFKMIFGTLIKWLVNMWVIIPLGIIVVFLLIKRAIAIKKAEEMRRRRKNSNRRNFYR